MSAKKDTSDANTPTSSTATGEGDETSGSASASAEQSTLPVTTEDLIPLIKAITFAYPDFIDKPEMVHQEIVSVASRTEPILTSITLDQVRIAYDAHRERTRERTTSKIGSWRDFRAKPRHLWPVLLEEELAQSQGLRH